MRDLPDYISDYEEAGLAPANLPPEELKDLARELDHVFTSGRPRSHQSAAALAPHAELIADPLFVEAPLASPPHSLAGDAGHQMGGGVAHPVAYGLSSRNREAARRHSPRDPGRRHADRKRAQDRHRRLVAHGYFNWMIGRQLSGAAFGEPEAIRRVTGTP